MMVAILNTVALIIFWQLRPRELEGIEGCKIGVLEDYYFPPHSNDKMTVYKIISYRRHVHLSGLYLLVSLSLRR